jgi:hypothetical protein
MKVYISGKITGEIPYKTMGKFGFAMSHLRDKGHTPFNPAVTFSTLAGSFSYDDIMKLCFAAIDICDAVYMLEDWHDSPGARAEHEYALKKGKEVLYETAMRKTMSEPVSRV